VAGSGRLTDRPMRSHFVLISPRRPSPVWQATLHPLRDCRRVERLRVERPADPRAELAVSLVVGFRKAGRVRVHPAPDSVEVEEVARSGKEWPFVLTVVENPIVTHVVRLDYDVQVKGTALRGEICLSIRPTNAKTWAIAATAGLALTLKRVAAVSGSLKADGTAAELLSGEWLELIGKQGWELRRLLCIPVIRGGLWLADALWRPLQEGGFSTPATEDEVACGS
jgi:hypothetical protein